MGRTLNNRLEKKLRTKLNLPIYTTRCIRIGIVFLVKLIDVFVYMKLQCIFKKEVISEQQATSYLEQYYVNGTEYHKIDRGVAWLDTQEYDLSIIIPCYNVEEYVFDCLESVRNAVQNHVNIEVLVIDDGSTDKTLEIIKEMKLSNNFKIIVQENKGLSGARNRGISNSKGQYLMFLDSDDQLISDNLLILLEEAKKNQVELIDGTYTMLMDNQSSFEIEVDEVNYSSFDVMKLPNNLSGYVWGRLFHRKLWNKTQSPERFWFEDTQLLYSIYPQVKVYKRINVPIVMYRINPEGITISSKGNPKSLDALYLIEYLLIEAKQLGIPSSDLTEISLMQLSSILFRRIKNLNPEIIESAFVVACTYVENYLPSETNWTNFYLRELYQAFINRDYKKWKLLSKYI